MNQDVCVCVCVCIYRHCEPKARLQRGRWRTAASCPAHLIYIYILSQACLVNPDRNLGASVKRCLEHKPCRSRFQERAPESRTGVTGSIVQFERVCGTVCPTCPNSAERRQFPDSLRDIHWGTKGRSAREYVAGRSACVNVLAVASNAAENK